MTGAEKRLWSVLRNRRLLGQKFRRQHDVGAWVIDFACPAIRLAIEVDGESHRDAEQPQWDAMKTEFLHLSGWRVLRVTNDDVYQSLSVVEARIVEAVTRGGSFN